MSPVDVITMSLDAFMLPFRFPMLRFLLCVPGFFTLLEDQRNFGHYIELGSLANSIGKPATTHHT